MADDARKQLSAKEGQRLGLPDGIQFATASPFSGMNQQDDRIAIEDNEFFFLENYLRIGRSQMRTLWDKGAALYMAPIGKTILSFFWFAIGTTNYWIVFHTDGTANQVDTAGNVTTVSATPGQFYPGSGTIPACAQWGTQYLLISNNFHQNNYWIWDGVLLYQAGTISPAVTMLGVGSGYTSAPAVMAFGGSGSGITAAASVVDGAVVGVNITSPGTGYLPGDIVQFAFSGGGTDSTPILTAQLTEGVISVVEILDGGSGYTGVPMVGFTGGGGTGAAGTATIASGAVTGVMLTSGGSGYTGTPIITFTGGSGTGAVASALFTAGTVSGVTVVKGGTNFTSTPTISFEGGGGSGAAGTVAVSGGAIYSVTMTSTGSGYTSAPGVLVAAGFNNSAYAEASLMPFIVSGAAIETFQSRVWLANTFATTQLDTGGVILTSAPESLSDFATSDGGNSFTANEPFLRQQYLNLVQAQGYLYTLADTAVDVISNVQTTSTTTSTALTTTFNYQNVDPQSGIAWRDSAAYFGLSVLYANPTGVYGLYGGSIRVVSRKMTDVFDNAVFPPTAGAITPCAAIANLHTIKCYLLLMTITDPITKRPRTVMLGWDETDWFLVSQSAALTYIGTQAVNSLYTAWGTDGATLFPLLTTPSSTLTKTFATKLYGANTFPTVKCSDGMWFVSEDKSANKSGVVFNVAVDSEYGSFVPDTSPLVFPGPVVAAHTGDIYGSFLGLTVRSNSLDYIVKHAVLGYEIKWGGYGEPPTVLDE